MLCRQSFRRLRQERLDAAPTAPEHGCLQRVGPREDLRWFGAQRESAARQSTCPGFLIWSSSTWACGFALSAGRQLLQTGRQIRAGVAQGPDGLLLHENLLFSLLPPHVGMRQYWRDLDALERWTRELPHQQWWKDFLRDSAGTGFWHETYFMRGGIEAIYDDMDKPVGLMSFAPLVSARGRMFSARSRLGLGEPS